MIECPIEIPELSKISPMRWLTTLYNEAQSKEIVNLLEQHIWITAKRKSLYVGEMSTSHIKNCIRCWNGQGKLKIPTGYLGGKERWFRIFEQELLKRN